ncbi:MAG: hypothetical protein FD126_1910, partial [Elusimicrobia bacterium]
MPLPEALGASGLPRGFLEPLAACFDGGQSGRVLAALRTDPARAARDLTSAFAAAAALTGLTPDELVVR